jgi:peptidoglycan hydrolase CwlO-like protein
MQALSKIEAHVQELENQLKTLTEQHRVALAHQEQQRLAMESAHRIERARLLQEINDLQSNALARVAGTTQRVSTVSADQATIPGDSDILSLLFSYDYSCVMLIFL